MLLGLIIIIIGILVALFSTWQEKLFKELGIKFRKKILYTISIIVVIAGGINLYLYQREVSAVSTLRTEQLLLTDLTIKFEILSLMKPDTYIGSVFGSNLELVILSKKDTLVSPFNLIAPILWKISKISQKQIQVNIFFRSNPELLPIGKRIKYLERYDAVKVPIGEISKSMNMIKIAEIKKIILVIYINSIESRRVEFPFISTFMKGDTALSITRTYVQEWFSRPFRDIENEYIKKASMQSKISNHETSVSDKESFSILKWLDKNQTPIWTIIGIFIGFLLSLVSTKLARMQLHKLKMQQTIARIIKIIHLPDIERAKYALADALPQFREREQIKILADIGLESSLNSYSNAVTKYIISELRWICVSYEVNFKEELDPIALLKRDRERIDPVYRALYEISYNIFDLNQDDSLLEDIDSFLQIIGAYVISQQYSKMILHVIGLYESITAWTVSKCEKSSGFQKKSLKFISETLSLFKQAIDVSYKHHERYDEDLSLAYERIKFLLNKLSRYQNNRKENQ